jgi:hypothetical protein
MLSWSRGRAPRWAVRHSSHHALGVGMYAAIVTPVDTGRRRGLSGQGRTQLQPSARRPRQPAAGCWRAGVAVATTPAAVGSAALPGASTPAHGSYRTIMLCAVHSMWHTSPHWPHASGLCPKARMHTAGNMLDSRFSDPLEGPSAQNGAAQSDSLDK